MPKIACQLVEVCVFRYAEDRAEYLVLKRSRSDPLYPGIWQVITGTIQEGEHAVDAALRELMEETGLAPTKLWVVPYSSTFYDRTTDTINISPLFAVQADKAQVPVLSAEHERYAWLPRLEARPLLVWPSQRMGLDVIEEYIVNGGQASFVTLVPLPC